MKKFLSLVSITVLVISFTSCKKDYTCECTDGSSTLTIEFEKTTKGEAETACKTYAIGGDDCKLK